MGLEFVGLQISLLLLYYFSDVFFPFLTLHMVMSLILERL